MLTGNGKVNFGAERAIESSVILQPRMKAITTFV
jgi:hypothetical protein